jgi:chloramphenicol 3-O-phosphotransferase
MPNQSTAGRPGTIIFLNGASSSGKTNILRALQEILEESYLDAVIDKFIWMLPERYLERPLGDDVLGKANHWGETGFLRTGHAQNHEWLIG